MNQYNSFMDWKKNQSERNKKIITALERLLKTINPNLSKTVKWGQGCFLNNEKHVIYIHTKPDYVQLGFYYGSSLEDPKNLLQGNGKYVRFIAIKEVKDINEILFTAIIKQVL